MASAAPEQWSSKYAFLMAAIGSAVGLGNIWRFPYLTGENGGGAFVIVYVLCVVLIALPILIAELLLGRHGHKDPISGVAMVAKDSGASTNWSIIGWIGALTGFFIVTFYSVVAGWVLSYMVTSATGGHTGLSPDEIAAGFDALNASPLQLTFWHTVFMGLTVWIVSKGVTGGIEKAVKFMMPAFFVMLFFMVLYASFTGDFGAAVDYLFAVDFSKINPGVVIAAVGQAFFSVGVAMGIMLTYGAYLPENVSIPRAAVTIAFADTAVAILAGLMIFPIVFGSGLNPDAGPGLVFKVLPVAFSQMTGGAIIGMIFFLLLIFAALTSAISMIQPMVSWAENRFNLTCRKAGLYVGGAAWSIGMLSVLGMNILGGTSPLGVFEKFENTNIMDTIDNFTAWITMPVGGLLIALFAGWVLTEKIGADEFGKDAAKYYGIWRLMVRILVPIGVLAILYAQFVGLPEA